jgi:hypothetical protein
MSSAAARDRRRSGSNVAVTIGIIVATRGARRGLRPAAAARFSKRLNQLKANDFIALSLTAR